MLLDNLNTQSFQAILYRTGIIRFQYFQISGHWLDETIQLSSPANSTNAFLLNEETTFLWTNYTTVTTTNYDNDWPEVTVTTNETNVFLYPYPDIREQVIEFTPSGRQFISVSPEEGTIPADGGTETFTFYGDARDLTANGTSNAIAQALFGMIRFGRVTNNIDDIDDVTLITNEITRVTNIVGGVTNINIIYAETITNTIDVTFTATNSVEGTFPALDAIAQASMWGKEVVPKVESQQNSDGSRTLSWPAPEDNLSRTYTVWYTTNLSEPFQKHPGTPISNTYVFIDMLNKNEPVIFYKVTVE
jgi:hypothetical protein